MAALCTCNNPCRSTGGLQSAPCHSACVPEDWYGFNISYWEGMFWLKFCPSQNCLHAGTLSAFLFAPSTGSLLTNMGHIIELMSPQRWDIHRPMPSVGHKNNRALRARVSYGLAYKCDCKISCLSSAALFVCMHMCFDFVCFVCFAFVFKPLASTQWGTFVFSYTFKISIAKAKSKTTKEEGHRRAFVLFIYFPLSWKCDFSYTFI